MSNQTIITIEMCEAAMFSAIGAGTQFSASGYTVIFSPEHRLHGRADLSGSGEFAVKQLAHAGIELTDQEGLKAYRAWRAEKDQEKALAGARYTVTAPFCEAYRGDTGAAGMFNRVILVNGHGEWVGSVRVEQLEKYDAEAINKIGQKGAFVSYENTTAITKALEEIRAANPEYSEVPFPTDYAAQVSK